MTAPIPAAWRAFGAFLRSPSLPPRAARFGAGGFAAIARLYPLDILVMVLLIAAMGALTLVGFELPQHALEGLEIGLPLIALIVVGAPLGEEILFRGWLSGRLGHVLASIASLPALLALMIWLAPIPPGLERIDWRILASVIGAFAFLAFLIQFLLREREAWGWFQRHFRWFYYASALAFASIHLVNFGAASAALLPLTLPQFILGLMLGYVRVNHGLWAAILFHGAHNALFIGVVLAAGEAS